MLLSEWYRATCQRGLLNQPMNTISTWSHIVSIIILTDALWLKCGVVFINFHILCFQCGSSGRGHKLLKEYKVIMNFIYMKKLLFCTKYCQATLNRLSAMSMNKINYHSPHLSLPPPLSSLSPPPHPPPLSSLSLSPPLHPPPLPSDQPYYHQIIQIFFLISWQVQAYQRIWSK